MMTEIIKTYYPVPLTQIIGDEYAEEMLKQELHDIPYMRKD
jgi:hypothetical protein